MMASTDGNLHLLKEKLENTKETIANLVQEQTKYEELEQTLNDLPKKIQHSVMVPLGKRAMMPGQIYRTNEILCHLGEEYYTWQSVCDSIKIIKRKQKKIQQQIKEEEDQYQVFVQKKNPFVALKQIYDEEKIKEIQETEEENEFYESQAIEKATQEDFDQYFEIEKEEENHIQQQQQILGSWEEMMQRMEALEALEEKKTIDSLEKQVDEFKSKGNQAFSSRNFQKAVDLYTKAIQLDPINHILYGNRAAAYHKLLMFNEALEDANKAINLDMKWVKGHYRKGCALEALQKYQEAAQAFEKAYEICPSDVKLEQLIEEMKVKANAVQKHISNGIQPSRSNSNSSTPASITSNMSTRAFNGDILERSSGMSPGIASGLGINDGIRNHRSGSSSSSSIGRKSRFIGNQERGGDVVTFEPVGEAVPVKRVSKFKAARAAALNSTSADN